MHRGRITVSASLLVFFLVFLSMSWNVLAAPPQKDICPAPEGRGARQRAVAKACRHFGATPESWGLHSAFSADGDVITCLHFSCKEVQADATPPSQDQAAPKRFLLKFSDAYLVCQPGKGAPQITAQGSVLSYGGDWEIKKLKPYLYHARQKNWRDFYWKVNTSRKQVYHVTGGTFGKLGGSEKTLDIRVDPKGRADNPQQFFLRFPDAYLVCQPGKGSPQIVSQGNVLSYGGDWHVKQLKPYLYHVRQKNWRNFYWKVNTSRQQVYRVSGGSFGKLGGDDKALDVTVEAVH
jgi:hypothetical protein